MTKMWLISPRGFNHRLSLMVLRAAPAAGAAVPGPPDAAHSDTDVSPSAPAPRRSRQRRLPPQWWLCAARVGTSGRRLWTGQLSGRSTKRAIGWRCSSPPPRQAPGTGPHAWEAPRLHRTPVIGADILAPAASAQSDQAPAAPPPGSGADRPVLPKGGPSPGLPWEAIPTVGIDEEPAAPVAKAAAAPSPMVGAPMPAPELVAPTEAAAAPATPMVVEPAEMPQPTAAERFERADAALRAQEAELRENERQLAIAIVDAREAQEEIRRLNDECAGWRRQQREHDAQTEVRDSDLQELRRVLAECEERLALARVMLLSLLER